MTKILLATPSYDGSVTEEYHESVLTLLLYLNKAHPTIAIDRRIVRQTLIDMARNCLASIALYDESYSHVLFIDSDIGFRPSALMKLLEFDKPIVGCTYPRRVFDIEAFYAAARTMDNPQSAFAASMGYTLENAIASSTTGPFARTRALGAGFTLIKRSALELLSDRFRDLVMPTAGTLYAPIGDKVFQPFSPLRAGNGMIAAEDLSFCARWLECGGELWACIDEPLEHIGRFMFRGRYIDKRRFADRGAP